MLFRVNTFNRSPLQVFFICAIFILPTLVYADEVRQIEFPVKGPNSFRNDFGEPRGGGLRAHQGTDIISAKLTPLVSAINGLVNYVVSPEASWGYEISLIDSDGYQYLYLHVNNDNPGTDDGMGGDARAYAPGVVSGASVTKGQLIGWVGDSGNAENTVPHLHFEIHDPRGAVLNPYPSLAVSSGEFRDSKNSIGVTPDMREALYKAPDGRPGDIFKHFLELGSTGNEVKQLQITLKVLGLLEKESITSYFGPKTRLAVMEFQKRQMINQTGYVGPKTREFLNRGISSGVLVEYKPYLSGEEQRAIQIQKLTERIALLQAQLRLYSESHP